MSDDIVKLRRTEEQFQAFVTCAPIGIASSYLDGRVFDANDAYLDMIGYTREELMAGNVRWDDLTPTEWLPLDHAAIEEATAHGRCRAFEKEYITRDGKRIPILVGFALVGPTREEALAFTVDLSAQKLAEAEVRRLNAELEERVATRTVELEAANKELEAFCYAVSHDLRAPLRSIDGFAYALLQDYEDKLDDEGREFVGRIRSASKRMDELISALLVLSRLTISELDHQEVPISELALAIVAELEHANPLRSICFVIQPDLIVIGDRRMLRSLLENLLSNAVKFSAGKSDVKVEFGREGQDGPFYVKDNGVGFDMSQSSKLFQPFERLHSPKEFTGSGIGLATVHRIVRKHGGRIWADAQVDQGATFYFTFTPYSAKDRKRLESQGNG